MGFAERARLRLLVVDLLQGGRNRRPEIGRGAARLDPAGRGAAGGALPRLVLVEDRTAHLQQPALVNAAHLIHPSWARRVATRLKKNAKGVPKILSTEIPRDERY